MEAGLQIDSLTLLTPTLTPTPYPHAPTYPCPSPTHPHNQRLGEAGLWQTFSLPLTLSPIIWHMKEEEAACPQSTYIKHHASGGWWSNYDRCKIIKVTLWIEKFVSVTCALCARQLSTDNFVSNKCMEGINQRYPHYQPIYHTHTNWDEDILYIHRSEYNKYILHTLSIQI